MEPAAVVAGTFVEQPAGDAGTGSAPAVTAESAALPKNKGKRGNRKWKIKMCIVCKIYHFFTPKLKWSHTQKVIRATTVHSVYQTFFLL